MGGVLIAEYIICGTYLGMTSRRYPILCITCAIAGCLLCIYVCQFLCKIMPNVLMKPLYEIGQHSILLFAVHFMDGIWYLGFGDKLNIYLAVFIRLLVDTSSFFAILFIKKKVQHRIDCFQNAT